MTNIFDLATKLQNEAALSDQCLQNILQRLDEDIARINERKVQLIEEFAARRAAIDALIGVPADA